MADEFDVVIAGSGAAGMTAALRASESGLRVLVAEKAQKYGGTSATSGGVIWVPNHGRGTDDTREQALRYLDATIAGPVQRDRLEAYVDTGQELVTYLADVGMQPMALPWPDYFPNAPSARADRSIGFPLYDGRKLGDTFPLLREPVTRFKLMNRYSMDFAEAFTISTRSKGWVRTLARVVGRYWCDFSTRRLTRRDRYLSLGCALIGPMRKLLMDRGVEVRLGTTVKKLRMSDGRVSGVEVEQLGRRSTIHARHGVIVCAGGFEWNQALRNRFFTIAGDTRWSSTPQEANRGELLEAALEIGAATEFTETGWWSPTMSIPVENAANVEETHMAVFDVGRPHSVCVNRNGDRFVDEACGYDQFGSAMLQDNLKTGANAPCWLVFDATFRRKFTAGGIMPGTLRPDRKIPVDWWDHYIFRAGTLAQLAAKIGLDPRKLEATARRMNEYARAGVDPEFGRGGNLYDRNFGDPTVKPNPCLGPIDQPPFYAVQINLGDLGTKGGLKADARARVLDRNDRPIRGLYAAGNASGSPFGDCYPGAGATIGPAMVFGFIAGREVAREAQSPPPPVRDEKRKAAMS